VARRKAQRTAGALRTRPTLAGGLFLAVTLLVGVAAVRSAAPLLVGVFGAMFGVLHVSLWLGRRGVAAVDVRRNVPARAWQHQTVHLGYDLRNLRRRHCFGLRVDEQAPRGVQSAGGYCLYLPPGGSFRAGARFTAARRGRVELGRLRLASRFPFSLATATRDFDQPAALIVWPARGRLTAPLLRGGAVTSSRAAPSQASGGQDEFFGLREYRSDDNPRWIHWRKSAGREAPVVREMARPLPEVLWVILDTGAPAASAANDARVEKMLRFAATLVDHAFARGYQVALALSGADGACVLSPAGGRGHRRRLLDALATAETRRPCRLDAVVAGVRPRQVRDAQVVVVTGRAGRAAAALGPAFRAACRHVTVLSADRLDEVFEDAAAAPEGA